MSESTERESVRHHRPLRSNALVDTESVRDVTKGGREYLVFPTIAAKEMVMNYPENGTKELLPAESIRETVELWAGKPLTYIHPQNPQRTANTADAYTNEVIGQVHNPEFVDGEKLRVEAWVDVQKANALGGLATDVVEQLRDGDELAVSTGYATMGDRRENGTHDGESYDLRQGTIYPDHLALFPSDAFQARCSPEDGCAAPRANAVVDPPTETQATDAADPAPDAMADEITDEHAKTLGYRFLDTLGLAPASDGADVTVNHCECGGHTSDADDEAPHECECGGVTTNTDASSDDDDAEAEDDPSGADDGADGEASQTTNDADTTMEYDIDSLAEQTAFDADTLSEWDDDELSALAETVSAGEDEQPETEEAEADATDGDVDGSVDADAGTEPSVEADGGEVAAVKENFEAELAELREEVESLKAEKENAEKREDARVVANAIDGMDMDTALELPGEKLAELAETHADAATGADAQTVNFGAMPGQVDRTPESDVDDYPAGGRSDWEQRQKEAGD